MIELARANSVFVKDRSIFSSERECYVRTITARVQLKKIYILVVGLKRLALGAKTK
jgi:hypothetical protein